MKFSMIRLTPILGALVLAACASVPKGPPPEIVRLDNQLSNLRADPRIAPNAVNEISKAQNAVDMMSNEGRRLDEPMFRHGIYIADRLVQTAESIGLARYAEQRGKELGVERDRLLVDVRSREAENARRVANAALATASEERRSAEIARAEANAARNELDVMRAQLTELQTKETERGLVVTLGDVLFEVDRAAIKPGATRALDQLANALRKDPEASITIEGHTDSTGSREHNMDLSNRRADSVRAYLVTHDVDPGKITARGLGPDYPVASNATEAGRQQNRRVEVIVNSSVAR
ncbi:MAG TPA: OmpA family protein [Dokdonella sp.]|uniref:OmpA family protein n=1 Tax=Dokdonella sp. TaxID=2291710 RepID=UPI002D80EF72|nr:OmpA family protein [Dokdonella sp.]HET9034077.1 OmpA family protein [Dokdonella sp.]